MAIIQNFSNFCEGMSSLFEQVKPHNEGKVADYIPQLGRVNPELFGMAFCTIDNQQFHRGDADQDFCIQSCCKPINYALALEEHGENQVHRYVGREPSGRGFNELALDHDSKPHNPMINAGAILVGSLIRPDLELPDRFDYVMERWRALAGGQKLSFSNATYLSERQTADRNYAIGYFLQEKRAFPRGTPLIPTLEFYFQCCSIESTCRQMARVAATLANGGICPATGVRIFSARTVRNTLALMSSCGMYDFSGEFAFTVGLPAKSGVSGVILVVVPDVMGLCVWSPRVDRMGNSVRGVEFCKALIQQYNFHILDSLLGGSGKEDPRRAP